MFISSQVKLFKYFLIVIVLLSSIAILSQQRTNYKILGLAVEGNKSSDANTIIVSTGFKSW